MQAKSYLNPKLFLFKDWLCLKTSHLGLVSPLSVFLPFLSELPPHVLLDSTIGLALVLVESAYDICTHVVRVYHQLTLDKIEPRIVEFRPTG